MPPMAIRLALLFLCLLPLSSCGSDPGDVCERAERKMKRCYRDASERDPAFSTLPLSTSNWNRGCPSSFDRCAAKCILGTSCEGIRRGSSSTDPENDEPPFDGCVEACGLP